MGIFRQIGLRIRKRDVHHWEYYNRLRLVSGLIKKLGVPNPRVLDVGDTTRNNLFKKFDIKDVTTIDIDPLANIVASADNIPFRDNAYDIVTCIDMLEHVPRRVRNKVVQEIVRVASKAVFLIAPVDSEENNRAEQLVLQYTKNQFIKEHQIHGLVDFEEIESILRGYQENERIEYYQRKEIDDLLNWVTMMIPYRVSKHKIYKEAYFLENQYRPRRIALPHYL